jgi:aldehyde dehydrogenase (NAD+)
MNYGQTCHAGTRIYVHEDVYDKFLPAYTKALKAIQVGDQFSDKADQGPHNSKTQYDKIMGYIEEGKKEGATLHLGGNALNDGKDGYFIEVMNHPIGRIN